MNRLARANDRRGERGSILVMSALGMLAVLLAVGLAVDISRFYLAKTELQNAADAAALAGASALDSSPGGITEAKDRAMRAMNKYDFNNTGVSFVDANILFAANLNGPYMSETDARGTAASIKFVQVTTPPSAIGVSFAKMVIGNSKNLSATATAGLSVPLNVFCNFIPLSVIDNDIPMTPGNTYTIRAETGSSPAPGNYQILAVAGPGGVDVEFGIGAGVDACAEPGTTYAVDTKTGLTSGKVRKGINARFDDYQGSQLNSIDEPPDTNIREGISHSQYLAARDAEGSYYHNPTIYEAPAASHQGIPNRRVVLIPIVKLAEYDNGRGTVRFDRFAVFFLRTKVGSGNGGDIQAEYLDSVSLFGKGGYNPAGGAGDPLTRTPVLYK